MDIGARIIPEEPMAMVSLSTPKIHHLTVCLQITLYPMRGDYTLSTDANFT